MAIQIDEIQTQVEVQDRKPGPASATPARPWQQQETWLRVQQRCLVDTARTAASGNDTGDA
ncbi:MAG: hypothetical protein Q7U73_16255 [Rubrivivax sp.]|nr:hypothetical protein [Rubrivivax sp.]